MPLTTFEEEIYLRALTGRLVGVALTDAGYSKIAVVAPKNIICSSIAAATEATIVERGAVTKHFMVEYGSNEGEIAKRLKEFEPQVSVLQFGGESPMEENKKSFYKLLKEMAVNEVPGDVVVHVRIFAAGGLDEAIKDEAVLGYLKSRNVYVYSVGFDEGKIYLNKIVFEDGGYKLQRIREYHVTVEHADLLNRSIKNRRLTFQ